MSLGIVSRQTEVFATTTSFCAGRVAEDSIYGLLHRECFRLFPDELFADLFGAAGRRSVPPMIVAVVMVLQRIEGCSDREAVERFTYDVRWKYAAGGLGFDHPGFVHTVLVDMRARLAASGRPERIFAVVLETAKRAGLLGRRRVLDSTALYDAVATMDTVTLIRSAIRALLGACERGPEQELRALLGREDDDRRAGKPVCDYDDPDARAALIDALAKDARALLVALDGRALSAALGQAARLLATVLGQDLDEGSDGVFRIARRVARERVISTVDPDARHGHKTSASGFDGFKGHVAVCPDSELITATTVTGGNLGDAAPAPGLLAEELPGADPEPAADPKPAADPEPAEPGPAAAADGEPAAEDERLAVYGDAAYGAGGLLDTLERAGAEVMCKVQRPVAPGGRYAKDAFAIDLHAGTVTCPAGQIAPLRAVADGRVARFGPACRGCPLAARCTASADGRSVSVGPHEAPLTRARQRQTDRDWQADYRATRPRSNARSPT